MSDRSSASKPLPSSPHTGIRPDFRIVAGAGVAYRLAKRALSGLRSSSQAGGTRLAIHVSYRVSTHFTGHAGAWTRWLVGDASHTILAICQRRVETSHFTQELARR